MNTIIGHTGFVGSNLVNQIFFENTYNSENIGAINLIEHDIVYCCGIQGNKYWGNKNEVEDKKNIDSLIQQLESLKCNRFVLLSTIDVFLFFPDWKREEPWARVIAEAMVSGCPVIALDKGGTKDQVLKFNNGFLCKRYNDYYKNIIYCIEHKNIISVMSKNSLRISKDFHTEKVIKKLLNIFKR